MAGPLASRWLEQPHRHELHRAVDHRESSLHQRLRPHRLPTAKSGGRKWTGPERDHLVVSVK